DGIAAVRSSETPPPERVLASLGATAAVLDGSGLAALLATPASVPGVIDRTTHEALVIHPREKQQRQHKAASLMARLLHALEGNVVAHTVARVAEKARLHNYPNLCQWTAECAWALEIDAPDTYVAHGEERLFLPLIDKQAFLCIHRNYLP